MMILCIFHRTKCPLKKYQGNLGDRRLKLNTLKPEELAHKIHKILK